MIDFHSHLLPGIDDGSDSIETSIMMLRMWKEQKVRHIVATPHFYADRTSPEEFLKKRNDAYTALAKHLNYLARTTGEKWPMIGLGAEVYYYDGISHSECLSDLCFNGTNLLLLEMPFCKWTDRIIDEVEAIYRNTDVIPVLAHIERYLDQPSKYLKRLFSMGIYIQCNAESLLYPRVAKKVIRMYERGYAHFLGSDAHNMSNRFPNMSSGLSVLESKLGADFVDSLEKKQLEILKESLVFDEEE